MAPSKQATQIASPPFAGTPSADLQMRPKKKNNHVETSKAPIRQGQVQSNPMIGNPLVAGAPPKLRRFRIEDRQPLVPLDSLLPQDDDAAATVPAEPTVNPPVAVTNDQQEFSNLIRGADTGSLAIDLIGRHMERDADSDAPALPIKRLSTDTIPMLPQTHQYSNDDRSGETPMNDVSVHIDIGPESKSPITLPSPYRPDPTGKLGMPLEVSEILAVNRAEQPQQKRTADQPPPVTTHTSGILTRWLNRVR
ncbi:hypothetical protein NHH03_20195 [Stieleria sp. TO1_6]|nr:hypothetical protein [Stieleria tagensis]